jgi:hypothetical protein
LAGYLYLSLLITVIAAVNAANLLFIAFAPMKMSLLANFIFALIAPAPLPWLIYHLRALMQTSYILERDGIRLTWGGRLVDIPMNQVLWVRLEEDDNAKLVHPRFQLHNALLGWGKRRLIDGEYAEVPVEFMASRGSALVLIATPERVYAISPQDAFSFVQIFMHLTEFGSLNPFPFRSTQPILLPKGIWQETSVRLFVVASLLLNITFFSITWSEIANEPMPTTITTNLEKTLPISSLWLLPFLNLGMSLISWVLAIFQYRTGPQAYMLWSNSLLATCVFMGALYAILQTR